MNRTIKIAVVFLWLGLQCCSTLKQWIISSQRSTKLRSNVTFEISTTINPSPSMQWLQYQNERFEYEKPRHTNLKTNSQNSLRRSNGHIELELESNRTMTTTSQNLSEIKDTADDSVKKGNKEIPSKPTISKGLIYKNVVLPSFDGFKAFLQSASHMWINGHSFTMNNKIGLLQKLKEKLLKAIENQFIILWQDDDNIYVRARRSILDESNINFPPEVALLSINFLTFAVFLIKLVLWPKAEVFLHAIPESPYMKGNYIWENWLVDTQFTMTNDNHYRLSLEHLKYLYSILEKNTAVSESNRGLLIESLRSIAEILIWDDQHDSSVFDKSLTL